MVRGRGHLLLKNRSSIEDTGWFRTNPRRLEAEAYWNGIWIDFQHHTSFTNIFPYIRKYQDLALECGPSGGIRGLWTPQTPLSQQMTPHLWSWWSGCFFSWRPYSFLIQSRYLLVSCHFSLLFTPENVHCFQSIRSSETPWTMLANTDLTQRRHSQQTDHVCIKRPFWKMIRGDGPGGC